MIATLCAALATSGHAQSLPVADVAGSSDSDIVGRLPGAVIVSHLTTPLDQAEYPKSELRKRDGRTGNNVYVVSPDDSLVAEGARTRNVYLLAPDVSPFAAVRAYEDDLAGQGVDLVYSCKSDACGGLNNRAGGIGGNWMSLAYYLWPDDRILDAAGTPGHCAQTGYIGNQEYRLFHDETRDLTVSVLAYTLKPSQFSDCKAWYQGRSVAIVDVISRDDGPISLTVVTSDEMQDEIASTGKIALYGINFDSGKDTLRADSKETIGQIADLLGGSADLRLLIVGHTDSVGGFDYNKDLSERRATSVVQALVSQYGIAPSRLFPVGVAFAAPVATNDSEDGRAQNRRVELVKF